MRMQREFGVFHSNDHGGSFQHDKQHRFSWLIIPAATQPQLSFSAAMTFAALGPLVVPVLRSAGSSTCQPSRFRGWLSLSRAMSIAAATHQHSQSASSIADANMLVYQVADGLYTLCNSRRIQACHLIPAQSVSSGLVQGIRQPLSLRLKSQQSGSSEIEVHR